MTVLLHVAELLGWGWWEQVWGKHPGRHQPWVFAVPNDAKGLVPAQLWPVRCSGNGRLSPAQQLLSLQSGQGTESRPTTSACQA